MTTIDHSAAELPEIEKLKSPSSPTIPTKLSSNNETGTLSASAKKSYLKDLQRDGYVLIPSLLPPHLLLAAQATSKYLVSRTRTGKFWPHVRTVPKQYPPWPLFTSPEQDLNIWGVQHLLHPDLKGLRDVYAEVYFANELLSVICQLLADPATEDPVPDTDLVMELFNLLISPARNQGFELEWHRDDIKPDVTPDMETKLLGEKAPNGRQLHAQYNIALFDDESLVVVPGSHRRIRTEAERSAGQYDQIPGQILVKMKPGDAVFYDSNIFHRGVYKGIDEKTELGRMTLHGSVGLKGYGEERSRQVLQHGIGEWVERDDAVFGSIGDPVKKKRADNMRQALVEMGKGKGDVGYSLVG